MLDALLEYSTQGHVPPLFADHKLTIELNSNNVELPERMEGNVSYSKFILMNVIMDKVQRS